MDEDTIGGTMFYRVSDKRFDSKNVKDTTLHTAFGDLSDGTNSALNLRAGQMSRVALLDFVIAEPPAFSQEATLVGYDLNLQSTMDSRVFSASSDKEDLSGNPFLDIFLMKDGQNIEYEGAVKPLDDTGATYEYRVGRGENWEQQEIAAFIASASDGTTKHFVEDFSGTPDKNINLNTTQGKVKQTKSPYITLQDAYDNKTQYGHLKHPKFGMTKDELYLFYGDMYHPDGKVVYLEAADDNVPPKNWKARTVRGTKGSLVQHPSVTAVATLAGVDALVSAPGGGGGMAAGTGKSITGGYEYSGYVKSGMGGGKEYVHKGFGNQAAAYGHPKSYAAGSTINTGTFSGKVAGVSANSNRAMASNSRMAMAGKAGYIGAAIVGAYTGHKAGTARNEALQAASSTGDFSGVSRPISEPKWKNKNIEDLIKYAVEEEYATITQFDENALTTTATWFDMVQEVRDYPKLEIVVEGGATGDDSTKNAYGSSEDMLAKSAINFAAGKDGQCMHMFSYCDFDMNKLAYNQEDMNFDSPKSPLQQDTYVSKFDLPGPVNIFQANAEQNDIDNNSTGNGELQQPWELSWDMKIGELSIPYTIHYDDEAATATGDSYLQTLRRCIAVTFSNKKPEENEDFYTYASRHWSATTAVNEAAWTGGSDMAGFVIDKTLEFTSGVPTFGKTMLTPIAFVSAAGTKHIEVYPTPRASEGTGSDLQYFADLQRDAGFMEIPMSTWLTFKMTCGIHGGSGKAVGGESQIGTFTGSPSSSDGSRTPGTYTNVAPSSTSGDGTGATFRIVVASGGAATFTMTTSGSGYKAADTITFNDASMGGGGGANITLTIATIDTTEHEGRYYLTVHDTGTGELIAPQQTGGDQEGPIALCSTLDDPSTGFSDTVPLNDSTKWLKHMSIWNVNHRWNAGANFDDMLGTKVRASGAYYGHDWWTSKATAGSTSLSATTNFASDHYTLMKNEFWVDNMKISGIEADIVNMTVNDFNSTSALAQNTFNEDDSVVRYHADRTSWARGGSLVTTHGPVNNVPPTVLALGFDNTSNIVGGADSNAEYLLFNDFWAESLNNTTRPVAFTDAQMKAGYSTGATKLGDWIDAFHTVEDTHDSNFKLSGSINATVTTLTVSNLAENSAVMVKVGDIVKCNSEKMLVTKVNTGDENMDVVRGVAGTTAASHGADNLLICGRSNFSKLLIGADASESIRDTTTTMDLITGGDHAGCGPYDKNRTSGHKTYVEGFSQKGIMTIENAMSGWIKGECIYASSKIAKIGFDTVAKENAVTRNTAQIVVSNPKVLDFEIGANGQQFIIYKYGATSSFHRTTGSAAIVTITKKGEVTDVVRDSTTTWGGSSGLDGCYLDTLITPDNLPHLYISPYKYWMCLQFDTAAHETDGTAQVTQRGYGSVLSIDKPTFSGSESDGFDFGRTFNESRFYVNSDDLTPYAAAAPLDIADEDSAIVKDVDFGMGTWNLEAAAGGMVTSFYPQFGVNRINLNQLALGGKNKPGDIVSLLISPNGSNRAGSEFSFWSGDFTAGAGAPVPAYQSHAVPQLVTKYFKPKNDNPGLGVVPAESNPYYPMYAFQLTGDYWYAYLMIDDEDIPDKYHKIHSYIPCNDITDGPWLNTYAMERGASDGNMKRLRAFGTREAIGKDNVGDAGGDYPIIYPTNNGLYNGTWGDSPARQSIQGLAGRCVDTRDGGSITFPWITGKVGGSGTQKQMSIVLHVTGEKSAADAEIYQLAGRILISQVSNKVQAIVYSSRSGAHHVKLTSTTSLPRDGVTPTNIILTIDTELTQGNVKLYMNGKLEAQSGNNVADAGAGEQTQWQFGETIPSVDSCNITFGTYDGLYEELTTYLTCIYPIDISNPQGTFILEKPIEEISSSTLGNSKVYNARLFACDYHNIRGKNVCSSPQVSFKKAAFNIDGT